MAMDPPAAPNSDPPGPAIEECIGMVCPPDMAMDRELWRWVPDGVSLLFTRTPLHPGTVDVEMAERLSDSGDVAAAVRSLVTVGPKVIAYACTSGSFVHGLQGERALAENMRTAGAPSAVTTSGALLQALERMHLVRVAVATPYDSELTDRLAQFLAEAGRAAVSHVGLGLDREIWKVPYETTCRLIRQADRAEADAVFLSCTNLPSYDVIGQMEQELGKPVLTANQVTVWAALRQLDRVAVGEGQLLGA